MKTIDEIARELNPRERFCNWRGAGDILFYQTCVRDSQQWKVHRGLKGPITWDIYCPFCKTRVIEAARDWSSHTRIGFAGCARCELDWKLKVIQTTEILEAGESACLI